MHKKGVCKSVLIFSLIPDVVTIYPSIYLCTVTVICKDVITTRRAHL